MSTLLETRTLPLLPLHDVVVFPYMWAPLFVSREKSVRAVEEAMKKNREIFLVAQKDAKINDLNEDDIYTIGTIGTIIQLHRLPDSTAIKVLVESKGRAEIVRFVPNTSYFLVEVHEAADNDKAGAETEALMRKVVIAFEEHVKLNKKIPSEVMVTISSIETPGRLADTIASHLGLKLEDKQEMLETLNPAERLEKLYEKLQSEISRAGR